MSDQARSECAALFNHVRTKVANQLYYGSKKGAAGTLAEGAGNDFDQAALLIALLRASNVPARYEYGTVELTQEQAKAQSGAESLADGNPLTYLWSFSKVPTGSKATLLAPTTMKPTFSVDLSGDYTVQLIVNDGKINSAPATVIITTANTAPVANAGLDQSVTAGSTVTLDGSGSTDVDGNALQYDWVFQSVPMGSTSTFSNPTAAKPTFVADKEGNMSRG